MKAGWCGFAIALLTLTGACEDDGGSGAVTTAAGTTASAPTTEAAAAEVRVYFVRDEKVAAAGRTVTAPAVASSAVEALLEGPDNFETGIGMTSQIPPGTELLGLDIDGGVATVDLSAEFSSGGGSLSMGLRVAEVLFMLTQFDTVDAVSILLEGEVPTEGIGGEGVPATDLNRRDAADLTPLVVRIARSGRTGELAAHDRRDREHLRSDGELHTHRRRGLGAGGRLHHRHCWQWRLGQIQCHRRVRERSRRPGDHRCLPAGR